MTRIRTGPFHPAALLAVLAVAATMLVAVPATASAQSQFQNPQFDDHNDIASVHSEAVYALVEQEVVEGCGDGDEYCPSPGVTREQMGSFIGRALGLTPDRSDQFEDVSGRSTHGGYIGALSNAGITQGCDDEGNYCPRDTITREQMATFLTRAYGLVGRGAGSFDDVVGGVHAEGVAGVSGAMVTQGCDDEGNFCPRDEVSREQMASFIARAMGLLRDEGCPTTVGPNMVSSYGTAADAADGFPVNSVERVGNNLHIFSMDVNPQQMVTYNLNSQRVTNTTTVRSGTRTWATHSPDGSNDLYFGQDDTQKTLYRFNTNNDQVQRLGTIGNDVTEFWDITSDDDGRLYLGTSDARTVYRYDGSLPQSQRFQQLTFSASGSDGGQVTQLQYHDGVLYIGTGRGTANLFAVDAADWDNSTSATAHRLAPTSGFGVYSLDVTDDLVVAGLENPSNLVILDRIEDAPEAGQQDDGSSLSFAATAADSWELRANIPVSGQGALVASVDPDGGTVYAAGRDTGTVFQVTAGQTSTSQLFSNPPIENNPTRELLVHNGELHGVVAAAQAWRSTLGSSTYSLQSLVDAGAPKSPARPQAIAAGNGQVAVSSNSAITMHQNMSRSTNVTIGGEPKAMEVVGNHLYAAVYPSGSLHRVPLDGSTGAQEIGDWNDQWGRPTDVHFAGPNRLLISAQVTQNSAGRGAVVSFERSGNSFGSPTLTQQWGGGQGASAVTSFRNATIVGGTGVGRVASNGSPSWSVVPVVGGGRVMGLETIGNEIHGVSANGTWFTLNANNGQVINTRPVFDGSGVGDMVSLNNWLYAVTGDCLVGIDTERNRVETLQTGLDSNTFGNLHTVAVDSAPGGNADVYAIDGDDLIRVRHTQR